MSDTQKTFKIICPHCEKIQHIRRPIFNESDKENGEEISSCLYCSKNFKIYIPRKYIGPDQLIRGIEEGIDE